MTSHRVVWVARPRRCGCPQQSGHRAMVSETRPLVLAKGHNARWPLDQSALLEVLDALKAAEVDDRIRQAAQTIHQALIEAELTAVIGAAPHQRTPERLAQRNGHRARVLATTAGDLELRIPNALPSTRMR